MQLGLGGAGGRGVAVGKRAFLGGGSCSAAAAAWPHHAPTAIRACGSRQQPCRAADCEVVSAHVPLLHPIGPTAGTAVAPSKQRRICVLALSRIADDPRVRRQCDTFHRAGWNVTAVGLPGARSPGPDWPILTTET